MNSKEYTDYLVEQLTELRDLIILIERGGNDTPDVLYKLALEKSRHITSYVQQWREEAAPAEVQIPAEYAEWVMGKTTEEAVIDEKREQAAKADEEMEKSVVDMPMDVALPLEKREAEPSDESADTPLPEETVDVPVVEMPFLSVEVGADTDDTVVEFPEDAPVGEVSLVVDDEEEAAGESCTEQEAPAGENPSEEVESDNDTVEVLVEDSDEPDEADEEQQVYNMGEPFDSETPGDANMTVGEMMSVRRAKELRRAISLNDRFRFRRELFGNSDVRMTETLALIDTMTDYGEAREYLLTDLAWDAEEPVVKEFLALVEKHFKQ